MTKLIHDGLYVTIYQQTSLGALELRPTEALINEFRNPIHNNGNGFIRLNRSNIANPDTLWDLLEDWLCNSSYELVNSTTTGDLIGESCPIILSEVEYDEMGDIIGYADKWYFSQYQVRNEFYDLYGGCLILDKAKPGIF